MARVIFFRLGATPLFVPGSRDEFGGAEVRAVTFAKSLALLGRHQVSFAVRHHDQLADSVDDVQVVSLPPRSRGLAKLVGSVRRHLTAEPAPYRCMDRIRCDVVACFGIHDPTPNVVQAARQMGIRSIVFLTSSEDVDQVEARTRKSRRRQYLHRFVLQQADRLVVQTDFQRQNLRTRFGREGVLIRNPIDCTVSEQHRGQARKYVLWVGRADRHSKRADLCLSIAKKCPEVPFQVVMHGGSPQIYQELAGEKPANVTLQRCVPLEEMDALFSQASVLINTSLSEGFPNAFLQAAKHETPVVSLSVDPDGFLTVAGCGARAGNESRMVDLIKQYHARTERIQAIGARAREYVESAHELSDRVAELDRLVEATVVQKRSA